MKPASNFRTLRTARRGSMIACMLVILVVMVAGVVLTTATASAVQAQTAGLQSKRDQAYYACEAGIQRALYEVQYGSWQYTTTYPPLYGTVGNCQYGVTATGGGWNSVVVVNSAAVLTSDSTVTCSIRVTMSPKNLVPAINFGGGIQETGNLTIDGNVMTKGNLNLGGMVAVNGLLLYGGVNSGVNEPYIQWADPATIPSPPSVWFDPTGTATPPSNVINVTPMIAAGSGAVAIPSNSPSSLDFRSASNGVLYYFGDLTLKNIDVYGSGTLVVFGNISVQNGGFGDSLEPVNIVATGNIATTAGFRIYGSLYANGSITHQGQFDVTGTVSGQGSMYPTVSSGGGIGGATINRAPPPPYDPRTTVGTGSIIFSNFSGPSF